MSCRRLVHLALLVLFLYNLPWLTNGNHQCVPSTCGNIRNISYPFRLKGDPENCGDRNYELDCESNQTVLNLYNNSKYFVQAINYNNSTIRITDSGIKQDNCSSIPLYTLTQDNFSFGQPYSLLGSRNLDVIAFVSCAASIVSRLYMDTSSCVKDLNSSNSSSLSKQRYSYAVLGGMQILELEDSCSITVMVMTSTSLSSGNMSLSYGDIHQKLVYGLELSWREIWCQECKGHGYCKFDNHNEIIGCSSDEPCNDDHIFSFKCSHKSGIIVFTGIVILVRILGGVLFISIYLIYRWRRRHLSAYDSVEEFLKTHNNLMPIRYSYSDIKKITKGFKDKLGEGGYGSVYKGQLRGGRLVAIKMLGGKSKANGQEFINEVATIGTIHHINVVHLLGFCVEKSKRALVYEFMPNGSLDKHIFSSKKIPLSCEKMFEIALGVARGIEYLHRGCDMRILHFDIKPHNILLDANFVPRVSDFGLAKLYPIENSIVSLTAVRGTMGYMAPELFYKNIGGISYKADVYSFGMLLMEMASRRKNMNDFADRSSEVYFPSWVYDRLSEGKEIDLGNNVTEEDKKILRKMIMVALWCIQMKPSDRPSMNKVVELLEGDFESLQMPPKPFQTPKGMAGDGIAKFRNLPWLPPGDSSNCSLTIVVNGH